MDTGAGSPLSGGELFRGLKGGVKFDKKKPNARPIKLWEEAFAKVAKGCLGGAAPLHGEWQALIKREDGFIESSFLLRGATGREGKGSR